MALTFLDTIGWLIWGVVTLLAWFLAIFFVGMALWMRPRSGFWPRLRTEARPGKVFEYETEVRLIWIMSSAAASWCVGSVLFFLWDWNKLHILWLAPVSLLWSMHFGTMVGDHWNNGHDKRRRLNLARRGALERIINQVLGQSPAEPDSSWRVIEKIRQECNREDFEFDYRLFNEIRDLSFKEANEAFNLRRLGSSPEDLRDLAVIHLLFFASLLRSQIVALRRRDFRVQLGYNLRVRDPRYVSSERETVRLKTSLGHRVVAWLKVRDIFGHEGTSRDPRRRFSGQDGLSSSNPPSIFCQSVSDMFRQSVRRFALRPV